MRSSRFWLVLAAVVFLSIALWWGQQEKRADAPTIVDRAIGPPSTARATGLAPAAAARASPATPTGRAGNEDAAREAERQERLTRYIADAEAELAAANIPIQFWGRVIDQANEPVAGVEVAYEFSTYVPKSGGDMKRTKGTLLTDVAGQFFIRDVRGHSLTIKQLTKTGYSAVGLGPNGESFNYAKLSTQGGDVYRPDANAPRIYKMERLGEPQPLWTFQNLLEVPVNGPPLRSSPFSEKLSGAFRLQFQTGPAANEKKTVYDWTFTVQLEGGSVQRSLDEFMSEAPADGYYDKIEVTMKTSNPEWSPRGIIRLFAKTATGRYGRFTIDVGAPSFAHSTRARVTIDGAVNPTGSRNLTPPASGSTAPGSR